MAYLLTHRINQDGLEHFFSCVRQMGACYEHPSPLSFKHRVRSHLVYKESALVTNCPNIDRESNDVSLSEKSFTDLNASHEDNSSLDNELCLSAMLFTSMNDVDLEFEDENDDDDKGFERSELNLETVSEMEGLRYVGGYIAHKFPQYQHLGTTAQPEDNSWIGAISKVEGKLFTPTREFWEELKMMEKLFKCYHGENSLKPGKGAIFKLAANISQYVSSPADVITFFVRCRLFFRMRVLNRGMTSNRAQSRKMAKVIKKQ